MNQGIASGVAPPLPAPGEEDPELGEEDDIPSDDGEPEAADESQPERRPLRDVERE